MQKTNGEHILDIAAMKFFDNENWEFQLAATLPERFKEVLTKEIHLHVEEALTDAQG
jgi:hypothetical protein